MHVKKILSWLLPLTILILVVLFPSCKKGKIITSGGKIRFSVDTLMFDTVFTAQGSSTRNIKIFNDEKDKIVLSSVRLRHGEKSAYRLNINGIPGTEIRDVEIAGKDSAWVFAAVTIDPDNQNTPFVVDDDLIVTLNGNEFSIPIIAFGQNAYYIVDSLLTTQTWRTDKPYVIIKNAMVAEGETLTIPAGVRVYVHRDSRLFVVGTLKIKGTKTDSVVFQGDRLDPLVWIGDYLDIPGQWGGVYFERRSHHNEIEYAVFKNGGASTIFGDVPVQPATIHVDEDTIREPGVPKLKISNTVIRSSFGFGILAFKTSIDAVNCRIVECGSNNVALLKGGKYNFSYCTIGTYGSTYLGHSDEISMLVLNYLMISQTEYESAPLDAQIKNCIVYGSLENEVSFDAVPDHPATIAVNNTLMRSVEAIPAFVTGTGNILNQDPLFVDRLKDDYHLQAGSPAAGSALPIPGITKDLDGKDRNAVAPSIGCFEFQ